MHKRSKTKSSRTGAMLRKRDKPSNASTNPNRKIPEKHQGNGYTHFRSKSKIKLLNLYNEKPDMAKFHEEKYTSARIEPDRKWFGNIRTINQKDLDKYRTEVALNEKNPYSFLLNKKKIDLEIFTQASKYKKNKLTDVEKFEDIFGPKMKRIKPKMMENSIMELAQRANKSLKAYNRSKDSNLASKKLEIVQTRKYNIDKRIEAGQSKRIWEELYKVIDSSDVLCMVLDARDPLGTKADHAEKHLEKNCKFKHIIYILNKTDLVPTSVTVKWVKYLSQFHPTIAYKAGVNKSFGREGLVQLIRQFDNFHKDKKTVSVGFIGYPNVGKSSVINSLRKKRVCKTAPIPGETKVWQYIALTKRIYLIDCPGVVYSNENDTEVDIVLKGVVRSEKLKDPDYYINFLIEKTDKKKLEEIYGIPSFKDSEEFLKHIALKNGRLLKEGEPDIMTCAKMVLEDWKRGNIPHFTLPPAQKKDDDEDED